MSQKIAALSRRVSTILGSNTFWWAVVGLFVLEALWLVISAQYPMAFDENYHFGLVQLHAHQWLPFFTNQPPDAGQYGAIVRDPSYLFHWLLSLPYRLFSLPNYSLATQVIVLRVLNVAMFTYGLFLYRRVLRRLGASNSLINSLFLIFILIPVVPFLAAHINYDNLLMIAVPATVLLAIRLMESFDQKRVDVRALLYLALVLLLGSLIKYPFLPVAAVTVLFLIWRLWKSGMLSMSGVRGLVKGFGTLSRTARIVLVTVCVVAFGLFAERYIINTVRYHTPVPACDAVISVEECVKYGPFGRDYGYKAGKSDSFQPQPFYYIGQWFRGMWYRLFFAINYNYTNYPPLLVISWTAVALAALLGIGIIVRFKTLFAGNIVRQLVLWLVVGYLVVLFVDGFSMYAETAVPVAINGRYLIPLLPFIFVLGGMAWSQILRVRPVAKSAIASVVVAIFLLQGGGAMTFIVRSHDDWMWRNEAVRSANRVVRSIAWPFIMGRKDGY